ncbi:MAG: zf-HC2 domain-containing protein, partial [Roseibium sp.]|nr:zf-HC2 domain-containing protein [Roseibium sp.]
MTDELIMAYADGELDAAEAKRVEQAAAADPEIQQKLHRFRETAARLKMAANDLPPVSDDLAQSVARMLDEDTSKTGPDSAENVVVFQPRSWTRYWPSAVAASFTLAVGLAAGVALAPVGTTSQKAPIGVAALADPEISVVLSSLASGSNTVLASGATLNVIASFTDA